MTFTRADEQFLRSMKVTLPDYTPDMVTDRLIRDVIGLDPLEPPMPATLKATEEQIADMRAERNFWILVAVVGWVFACVLMAGVWR